MMHAENRCLASGFAPLRTTCTHVLPVLEAACPDKGATVFWFLTLPCIDRFLILSLTDLAKSLPYFHTWCGLSANLGLKRAARGSLKIQDGKIAKNSPSGHHPTNLSDYIFATKSYIDNRKKAC